MIVGSDSMRIYNHLSSWRGAMKMEEGMSYVGVAAGRIMQDKKNISCPIIWSSTFIW